MRTCQAQWPNDKTDRAKRLTDTNQQPLALPFAYVNPRTGALHRTQGLVAYLSRLGELNAARREPIGEMSALIGMTPCKPGPTT